MSATSAKQKNATGPSPADRRVWVRYTCDLPVACNPVATRSSHDSLWSAKIRDISAGGLGLVVDRRFERGTGLSIEWKGRNTDSYGPLLVRVVHATQQEDG
ncbi:MAG: PilZ domain-containing protein, partial [Planctomycetota bacterium]